MSKRFRWLTLASVCIAMLLVFLIGLQAPTTAQSVGNLSSRISRLESESSGLRSQISRLESQVSRLSNAAGVSFPRPAQPEQTGPNRGTLSSDPMFDRLATLAIEQKERMDQLEARLAALEARLPRR